MPGTTDSKEALAILRNAIEADHKWPLIDRIQADMLMATIEAMQRENAELRTENERLKNECREYRRLCEKLT